MHDSLQYHFFFPGVFVALRVFHTASLQSVTAWAYDFAEPQSGAVELVNTYPNPNPNPSPNPNPNPNPKPNPNPNPNCSWRSPRAPRNLAIR